MFSLHRASTRAAGNIDKALFVDRPGIPSQVIVKGRLDSRKRWGHSEVGRGDPAPHKEESKSGVLLVGCPVVIVDTKSALPEPPLPPPSRLRSSTSHPHEKLVDT